MVWYDSDYGYKKKITIDHTLVGGDETDFPVLISITDNDLRDEANGGHVKSANGYDIIFTNSAETVQLKHEIERYVNTSGLLVFWVKVSSLSSTVDTDIYIYYGKAGVGADPSTSDTWDSDFMMVHHLKGANAIACDDSTSNNNDVSADGGTPDYQQAGKIGYGVDFINADNDYLNIPDDSSLESSQYLTIEAWMNRDGIGVYDTLVNKYVTAGNQRSWTLIMFDTNKVYCLFTDDGTAAAGHYFSVMSNNAYTDVDWVYIVAAIDAQDADAILIYKDGSNVAVTKADNGANAIYNGTAPVVIAGHGGAFEGLLDEIRLSKVKRSTNWIGTTHETQNDPAGFMSWGAEETEVTDISAGIKVWDGTADIELIKDDTSPVKIRTPSATIGVKITDTGSANASAIRVRISATVTKALKKKT